MKLGKTVTAFAVVLGCSVLEHSVLAIGLDDIQFWVGSGANRAGFVVEWSTPEVMNNTEVLPPVGRQSLVWGYRWDGDALAVDMFNAVMAADPRLFSVLSEDTGYGSMVLGLGYDLNGNGIFGVQNGSDIRTASVLSNASSEIVNGVVIASYGDADVMQSLDGADLYWGGFNGPGWNMWSELGGAGGYDQMPERGVNPYWTPDDPAVPWTGSHGQWLHASGGLNWTPLADGSWIGFTVLAGGLDYMNPTCPGTIAYNYHKAAPSTGIAAPEASSCYAVEVVSEHGPYSGSALYSDPNSILGEPATLVQNLAFFGPADPFHIKMVEPAYNLDLDGNKVILTLEGDTSDEESSYGTVVVKFDHPIYDDPANPYGIDFEVFGNAMYIGTGGFVSDSSDMRTYLLGGGCFAEPVLVSVSPDGENWYTYRDGPYGDSAFPTHAYEWDSELFDSTGSGWSKKRMDFTKPVNPALSRLLGVATEPKLSVANAILLYAGSGGGTGFDLAESGFASIQYIRVEAGNGFTGGEIDAFSDVRPARLGEGLTVAPGNIADGNATLYFQDSLDAGQSLLKVEVQSVETVALVTPTRFLDEDALTLLSKEPVAALNVQVAPVLGTDDEEAPSAGMSSDIYLNSGLLYKGDRENLEAVSWDGSEWKPLAFSPGSGLGEIVLKSVSDSLIFALVEIPAPALAAKLLDGQVQFSFTARAGWSYIVERSGDLATWETVDFVASEIAGAATLQDENPPKDRAFYRLRATKSE